MSSTHETRRSARDPGRTLDPSALVGGQRARPLRALADALLAHASVGALVVPGPHGAPLGAIVAVVEGRLGGVIVIAPPGAGVGRSLERDPRASVLVASGASRVTLVGVLEALSEAEAARARSLANADDDALALRLRAERAYVRTATLGGWIDARPR